MEAEAHLHGLPADGGLLFVDTSVQRCTYIASGAVQSIYPISTSRSGTGNRKDTGQTPTGWHRIVERYGADAPLGAVFISRRFTGRVLKEEEWRDASPEDLILTRILRLAGLEPAVNQGGIVDTYSRFIYLHGTNHEHLIGSPASAGCIRLKNNDLATLFHTLEQHREVFCLIK